MRNDIAEILKALPVREDHREQIGLWAFRIVSASIMGGTQDIPRARRGGAKKAERALVDLHNILADAVTLINTMPREAHEAMPEALEQECALIALASAARAAHGRVINHGKPGRPPKVAATAVARETAWAFEALTGKPATVATVEVQVTPTRTTHKPSGPFYELVSSVFDALDIDASAERPARDAVKEKRASKKAY